MAAMKPEPPRPSVLPTDLDCRPASDRAAGSVALGLGLIVGFFGIFGAWSALAPLESYVIAPGVVKVEDNRKTVQHREGGLIAAVLVRDGDRVEQGQVLIRLDDTELRSIVEVLTSQYRELRALEARLIAERDDADTVVFPEDLTQDQAGTPALDRLLKAQMLVFKSRREEYLNTIGVFNQRISQLNEQITGLSSQVAYTSQQMTLIKDELAGLRELLKVGATPLNHVRATERMAAALGSQLGGQKADIGRSREAISEMRLQILSLKQKRATEVASQLRETQQRQFEILPQLQAKRVALGRTELRAPVSGHVVGLSVFTNGGVIQPGERVMDIVPSEPPLLIQARIRPDNIDDIAPNQRAEIRLTGLKQRALKVIHGTLRRISADSLVDNRTGQGYFTAEVEVDLKDIADNGIVLVSGMPADVLITVGTRTALSYLAQPLSFGLRKAMSEP
jgi:HlyD family type I secretion membrane fusion protein